MSERRLARIALTGLRIALGTAFLSAVASRLGLWGSYGGDWAATLRCPWQPNAGATRTATAIQTKSRDIFYQALTRPLWDKRGRGSHSTEAR